MAPRFVEVYDFADLTPGSLYSCLPSFTGVESNYSAYGLLALQTETYLRGVDGLYIRRAGAAAILVSVCCAIVRIFLVHRMTRKTIRARGKTDMLLSACKLS